jgi:predicted nucleic-acid-binding protein
MLAVDSNILVRLLTRDNAEQASRATAAFQQNQIWISKTVLMETVWVLESVYGLSIKDVTAALWQVVALPNVRVEEEAAVMQAFSYHQQGLDLIDALHVCSSGAASEFITFDSRLAKRAQKTGSLRVRAL